MHALILLVILSTTVAEYFATLIDAPGLLKFIPDVLSGLIAALVLLEGVRKGFATVALRYWIGFGLMAFIILAGILANAVGTGPIIAGSRYYLRAIPLFFVPAFFTFTERQVQQQLKLLLSIGLAQLPLAAWQRYVVMSQGRFSGDPVQGTLLDSGVLSLFLISGALVLLGFHLRGRIGRPAFLVLFLLLLLPTTINETKATVLLLPIGLIVTVVAGVPRGKRMRAAGLTAGLLVVFGAILVPVYDAMEVNNPYKNERHLLDFYTSEQQIDKYMINSKGTGLGIAKDVRRGDAISVPYEYLARDPLHLAFGLGLGNASNSALGQSFVGQYYQLFQPFAITSFSVFLLEMGFLGTAVVLLLYMLAFLDARATAREDHGLEGAIAVGWMGVVAVMAAATFYTNTHNYASLSYLYWYFCGTVAVRRCALAVEAEDSRPVHAVGRASG